MNQPTLISRRSWMRKAALAVSAGAAADVFPSGRALAALPDSEAVAVVGKIAADFMERFEVPGLSVAFSLKGKPVYSAGFGFANRDDDERMTPEHRFRVASISKPITAVAIFKLIEEGTLKLDDKAFAPDRLEIPDKAREPGLLEEITIRHLLTHTSGGWKNDRMDPMFSHPKLAHDELIEVTLREMELSNAPGTHFAYSNFGYCLLGRLIEKLTNKTYEDFVGERVLRPCGISGMAIAGDTLEERAEREVIYYGRNGENPYGMNVRRMDSHGGWMGSTEDLVKFLVCTDGFPGVPDLLSEESMKTMMETTDANPGYACGWSINRAPHWWHGGSLPGTATIAVRTASGLCWAGFTNARNKDIAGALDKMMWDMAKAFPEWQA